VQGAVPEQAAEQLERRQPSDLVVLVDDCQRRSTGG
jgi:hypothetical protein